MEYTDKTNLNSSPCKLWQEWGWKSLVTYYDYHGDFCIKLYSVLVKGQATETTL